MKKDKILVFPCGSEIGLEIYRSFFGEKKVELIGASSVEDHGKYIYKNYISGVPFVNDKKFIDSINKIISKYKIDFIFPAHDDVGLALTENKKELGCPIITSDANTWNICRSKRKTYLFFKNILHTPKIFSLKKSDKISFPVYLKPDVGQGSKNNFIASSIEELLFYKKNNKDLLILEFLPGKEYTVDCFTDLNGKLVFIGPRVRARVSNGISVNTYREKNKEITKIAEAINKKLKLKGAWFFQLKKDIKNRLYLLEVAPRIAGSMSLYRNLGINFPVLSYFLEKGINCNLIYNDIEITMDRALSNKYTLDISYKNVYVDFDDSVIISNKKINTKLIEFLYQCFNRKVKIHLISKHNGNLKKQLKKLRILDLFDSITQLKNNENKYSFIKNKNSIFIDDSFSEREEVKKNIGIPVFSIDMIESLILGL